MNDAELKGELDSLAAETLVLQALLAGLLDALAPRFPDEVRKAFDFAEQTVESVAIQVGKGASKDHTLKAVQILEQLRRGTT
jgi:hypothetical protein